MRAYLAAAVTAVESRDALTVRDLIADDYADSQARDKRSLSGLAAGYFLRHKNIHLFKQIDDIQFPENDRAQVRMRVAMLGSPLKNAEALLDVRADIYQFDLSLAREDGDWLLKKASWQRGKVEDLFSD